MGRLTLTNLETLCWIARLGTFTAAAKRLNTTQPAISNRVRELEQGLGVRLFQRRGRRMELTIQGRHLVDSAQPLLLRLEDLVISLDNPSAATGTIRLGVGEIVAGDWLGPMIARLKTEMPLVNYEIEVALTFDMRQRLEDGQLDIAIVAAPIDSDQLVSTYIGSIAARWLIAPALVRAQGRRRPSAKVLLEQHPVWCLSRPSHMYPMALGTLRRHGVQSAKVNTCDNIHAIVELVAERAGVALVPENLAAPLMRARRVVSLCEELPPETLDFVIATHRHQNQAILRHIERCAMETSTFERRARSS
jgi:DNA-binding transcriptional LysR family regulator